MRRLIVGVLSFLAAASAGAQTGTASGALKGYVRVKDTATPLTIAEVEIPALRVKTRTDVAGSYEFPSLPAGRYLVVARAIGFSPRGDSIAIVVGKEQTRHFELPRATTQLDTAMILSPAARYISPLLRGFEDRRTRGIGRFITEEELRQSDNREFADVVRKIPGATVIRRGGSTYFVSSRQVSGAKGAFLGAPRPTDSNPTCYVTIYQDGVLAYDMGLMAGSPPPRMEDFNVREWAGIEFYAGTASIPAQFKSSACGVLLLWTRER